MDSANLSGPPTIAQLLTHSLSGVVQDELERMILSGELPPGSRLNESVLARKLSVSRGPIREACRALAESGLVNLVPNLGAYVAGLDKADAMEVYDLRAGITGLAASLLAPLVTERHVADLNDLLARMEHAAEGADSATFNRLNLEFHEYIVEATDNRRLVKTYGRLAKEFRLFRMNVLVQQDGLRASNNEHRAIVAALEKRNPSQAYEVSFAHVASGKQRMLTAFDASPPEPSRSLK